MTKAKDQRNESLVWELNANLLMLVPDETVTNREIAEMLCRNEWLGYRRRERAKRYSLGNRNLAEYLSEDACGRLAEQALKRRACGWLPNLATTTSGFFVFVVDCRVFDAWKQNCPDEFQIWRNMRHGNTSRVRVRWHDNWIRSLSSTGTCADVESSIQEAVRTFPTDEQVALAVAFWGASVPPGYIRRQLQRALASALEKLARLFGT